MNRKIKLYPDIIEAVYSSDVPFYRWTNPFWYLFMIIAIFLSPFILLTLWIVVTTVNTIKDWHYDTRGFKKKSTPDLQDLIKNYDNLPEDDPLRESCKRLITNVRAEVKERMNVTRHQML